MQAVEVKQILPRFAEAHRQNPKKTGEKPEKIEVKEERQKPRKRCLLVGCVSHRKNESQCNPKNVSPIKPSSFAGIEKG